MRGAGFGGWVAGLDVECMLLASARKKCVGVIVRKLNADKSISDKVREGMERGQSVNRFKRVQPNGHRLGEAEKIRC